VKALFNEKNVIETATKEASELITKDHVLLHSQLKVAVTAMFKKEFHASKAQAQKIFSGLQKSRVGCHKKSSNTKQVIQAKMKRLLEKISHFSQISEEAEVQSSK
jgi:hypothetical protein